jgi:hypothetical protein
MPNITFEQFQELARRAGLPPNERIDDPLDTRAGKVEAIVADILAKLPRLRARDCVVADIGPGCGPMAEALSSHCQAQGHRLWLIDSPEMLAHSPDAPHIVKVPGKFPRVFAGLAPLVGRADAVIVYSMLHYVFGHENVWEFLDRALELPAPGGRLLLGDVPSWSKRRRMLAAPQRAKPSWVDSAGSEAWPGDLTDAVLFGLMARGTEAGFDAYLLPQPPELPMADRRVDLLFERPG